MYYYISHLSGVLFSSDKYLDYKDLYCDECGDNDDYLGYFDTEEEAQAAYDRYWL